MAVYEIIIRLYFLAIVVASLFSIKAKKWIEGRRNLRNELQTIDFSQDKWLWFFCSSYGEFQDGKYLIEQVRTNHPEYKILLTFFSSTGVELTKDFSGADYICYLPLDTKSNAEFFVQQVKPQCIFFIRNDIWPNYIRTIQAQNIPVFLAIFALNAESTFFKFPVKGFYQRVFQKFNGIFVQDTASEKLLKEHGYNENVIVAGNARIDRVIEIGQENFRNDMIENFVGGGFCFVAGSTHVDDRRLFLETFLELQSENKMDDCSPRN
jgi:3-deoxy-D-manno-octulosonic-acid transferase